MTMVVQTACSTPTKLVGHRHRADGHHAGINGISDTTGDVVVAVTAALATIDAFDVRTLADLTADRYPAVTPLAGADADGNPITSPHPGDLVGGRYDRQHRRFRPV